MDQLINKMKAKRLTWFKLKKKKGDESVIMTKPHCYVVNYSKQKILDHKTFTTMDHECIDFIINWVSL